MALPRKQQSCNRSKVKAVVNTHVLVAYSVSFHSHCADFGTMDSVPVQTLPPRKLQHLLACFPISTISFTSSYIVKMIHHSFSTDATESTLSLEATMTISSRYSPPMSWFQAFAACIMASSMAVSG